jgi:hypothetical protein
MNASTRQSSRLLARRIQVRAFRMINVPMRVSPPPPAIG